MSTSHPGPGQPPSPSHNDNSAHNDNSTDRNILLFGMTGAGKSTLGNMLVGGTLIPPEPFRVGSCINVATLRPGYRVTDTVGFQGAARTGGLTEDEQAKHLLVTYVNERRESYSHIIFVQKAGKLVPLDHALWEVFKTMFKGAERAFMLVISKMDDPNWITDNKTDLEQRFGNVRMVGVDFKSSRDPVRDAEYADERLRYQTSLDEALEALYNSNSRSPCTPEYVGDPKGLEKIFKQLKKISKKYGYKVLDLMNAVVQIVDSVGEFVADVQNYVGPCVGLDRSTES